MSELTRNPDILTCLANLSNDEVFTPPEVANAMLDLIPEDFWKDPNVRVLDPACKSGVFLREAAKRFLKGEEEAIPDLQERIDHIFHKQLFGYAITELTSHLSRRTVYCSKSANGKYSVTPFKSENGNIAFSRVEHTWEDGKCKYCGASQEVFDKGAEAETHAYKFIHLTSQQLKDLDMKFDLIIGNPPYQIADGGAQASAKPIYHLFIEQAKKLKPRYMTMIIPARWYSGGKGLDEFRSTMLHDRSIIEIHDFPDSGDVFPGVQIKAGVMYFLWERDTKDDCNVYTHMKGEVNGPIKRPLLEKDCETFIRYNEAIDILDKVTNKVEDTFSSKVSTRMPFGIPNTYKGQSKQSLSDLQIYVSGNDRGIRGGLSYAPVSMVSKNKEYIDCHKVFIGYAGSGSDSFPHMILTKPFYGEPKTICNETYLMIGPFSNKQECLNVISYISTRFFRFLVLQKKATQHVTKSVFDFVPMQDFSKPWTDEELYEKYGLTDEEIAFIESMIKPME